MVVHPLLHTPLFCQLSAVLKASNCDKLLIGRDNETSMRNAIWQAFPKRTQSLFTLHLKQNVERNLLINVDWTEKTENIIETRFLVTTDLQILTIKSFMKRNVRK